MKTIKVIDLLNKIVNGEKVPKKIKWGDHNLTWVVYEYKALDELGDPNLFECAGSSISRYLLNDTVEIIEEPRNIEVCGSLFTKSEYDELAKPKEDKKIEKLELLQFSDLIDMPNDEIMVVIKDNRNKINEIIKRLNGE